MGRILVIDDTPFWRDTTADALRLKGHDVFTASDGLEGLAMLGHSGADLVILDVEMPKLQGFGFLEEIRGHEQWKRLPVIMLTGDMQKEQVLRAKTLGAVEYLLKSRFSVDAMMERVARRLAGPTTMPGVPAPPQAGASDGLAASVMRRPVDTVTASKSSTLATTGLAAFQPLLSAEQCLARVGNALSGRALSGIVAQVIAAAASPRTDAQQIASLIARDPMLAARVLQAANSAAYASSRGAVTTIPEAVRNVGCTTIRNIAAALGIFDTMPGMQSGGFNPIRCWQHSFAVAQLCDRLCAASDPENAGIAYLIGLCHDLGEILFQTHFGSEYCRIVEVAQETARPRPEIEQHLIGMTHGDLVLAILHQIGLPESIRQPIEAFHKADGLLPRHPLAQLLHMADLYANGILMASSGTSQIAPLTQEACTAAVGQGNPDGPDAVAMRSEVFALTALLAQLSKQEEAALLAPLYPRQDVTIYLVRDRLFSSFDPIAAALSAVATVEISSALSDHSRSKIDGLVVVTQASTSPGLSALEIDAFRKRPAFQDLPTVWFSADPVTIVPRGQLAPRSFPLELMSLMEFVEGVREAKRRSAA